MQFDLHVSHFLEPQHCLQFRILARETAKIFLMIKAAEV